MKLEQWWEKAKAGERNALVARRVMSIPTELIHHQPAGKEITYGGITCRVAAVADYQGSIPDAWDVVEKMRAGGWFLQIKGPADSRWAGAAQFTRDAAGPLSVWTLGRSVQEATCLAALKAVGVEEV